MIPRTLRLCLLHQHLICTVVILCLIILRHLVNNFQSKWTNREMLVQCKDSISHLKQCQVTHSLGISLLINHLRIDMETMMIFIICHLHLWLHSQNSTNPWSSKWNNSNNTRRTSIIFWVMRSSMVRKKTIITTSNRCSNPLKSPVTFPGFLKQITIGN